MLPLLLLFAPTLVLADEVYLKGAGTISGRIIEQTETTVTVDVGGGTMGVPMSRVERIEKGRSALDEYEDRANQLALEDAGGWRTLARWASKNGLPAQSREAYATLLEVLPDDAEAREALGFVRVQGHWMTEEEGYRALGYVKFDGEWMTPQEAQTLQANEAAERAHWDAERSAIAAESAQQEADKRAREAEEDAYDDNPVYWGGWGYGMTYWPATTVAPVRPRNRPADRPSRPVR